MACFAGGRGLWRGAHRLPKLRRGTRPASGLRGWHAVHLSRRHGGDGLADLVRIRNGEVCYWPNLGYSRFGAKVTMDNSPWFDPPDQFEQRRVRLADIDGSGTSDLIYLARDDVRLYFNQSGNRLSEARRLAQFPVIDNVSSVMTADLLGNGTACLVWSSPLPANARRTVRYIDLMGGTKPHLLIKSVNNLGVETEVHYAASTRFYLEDKRNGRSWVTRLPFPVHVVERVVTHDRISGNQFVTSYAYLQSQTMKAGGWFPATDADDHWWIPSEQSFFTTNPADPAGVELAQARQHFFLARRYRDPFMRIPGHVNRRSGKL
jgi:hypothetical protein